MPSAASSKSGLMAGVAIARPFSADKRTFEPGSGARSWTSSVKWPEARKARA